MPLAQRINDLRKHGFRTGHKLSPQASTAQVQEHSSTKIVKTGKDKPELRKSKRLQEATDGIKNNSTKDTYIIASVERLDVLFYRGYSGHQLSNPACTGQLQMMLSEQLLLSGTWCMVCQLCGFSCEKTKLYKEVKSNPAQKGGRLSSTLNLAAGNALLNSPIGVQPFREILMRLGIDPGSAVGLQNIISNKSNQAMIKLAEENMRQIREELKVKFSSDFGISVDSSYNNRQNSNSAFQAGTQSRQTIVEDMTEEKKVILLTLESKLCSTRHHRLKAGLPAECPNHEGCTATIKRSDAIGDEARASFKSALELDKAKCAVARVTNDGDSKIIWSFRAVFGDECETLKDPRHFSLAQKKYAILTPFSMTMFPGETKVIRDRFKKRFAEDLRQRCSAELSSVIRLVSKLDRGDKDVKTCIVEKLENTPQAMIKCYMGDHEQCASDSYVCNPEGDKVWPKMFVPTRLVRGLDMTDDDKEQLEALILLRLGADAIKVTYTLSSTQKNEAVNRSFSKYNSKTVTCSRTWTGRVHAAVLNINAGFGEASRQILAEAGHAICEKVNHRIQMRDLYIASNKRYAKLPAVKMRRLGKQQSWNKLHEEKYGYGGLAEDLGYISKIEFPAPTLQNTSSSQKAGPR